MTDKAPCSNRNERIRINAFHGVIEHVLCRRGQRIIVIIGSCDRIERTSMVYLDILGGLPIMPLLFVFAYKHRLIMFIHPLKEAEPGQTKFACFGDSITYGATVRGWTEKSCPSVLNHFPGHDCLVTDYGYPGCRVMKSLCG